MIARPRRPLLTAAVSPESDDLLLYQEACLYCAVNPSAWSDTLFESELFGHERRAFTGASKDRKGLFETVSLGGALFLDEIGELTLERRPKLLRVFQEHVFHRVGDLSEHPLLGAGDLGHPS